MRTALRQLFFGLILLYSAQVGAQEMNDVLLFRGKLAYNQLRFSDALVFYKRAYQKSKDLISRRSDKDIAAERIADCYWMMRNFDSAFVWYQRVPSNFPDPKGKIKYRKAEFFAMTGDYPNASAILTGAYGWDARAKGFQRVKYMLRDSTDWNVSYIHNINTDYYREFSPIMLDSGMAWATNQPKRFNKKSVQGWDNMGFTRMIQLDNINKLESLPNPAQRKLLGERKIIDKSPNYLALHYSGADVEQVFRDVYPQRLLPKMRYIDSLTRPVGGMDKFSYNLAHATYNTETKKIYFSANRQDRLNGELRTVSIIEADKDETGFSKSDFILGQNEGYSNMHPAIHPNGTTLVFSSNRKGGIGGYDLYYVVKTAEGNWSSPRIVAGVNTIGNELFASFAPDGTLYFSSDGHPGLGGMDLYRAKFTNGKIGILEHLSYPMNSSFDDFGMSFNSDGKSGFLTSDKLGSDDIYSFVYDQKTTKIVGRVVSDAPAKGISNVNIYLYEFYEDGTPFIIDSIKTNNDGGYELKGRPNRKYLLNAFHPLGNAAISFDTEGVVDLKQLDDIVFIVPKTPVKDTPYQVTQVPDTLTYIIYFDFDKSKIDAEAKKVLDEVVDKLKEEVGLKIALYGHTDEVGSHRYNDRLAARRAKSARAYLIKSGVERRIISLSSFGKRMPVIKGASKEAARFNRRVEISMRK